MSLDLKGRRFCDGCGRLLSVPHRIDGRDEFCSTCYQREFVVRLCSCGATARIRRSSSEPVRCRTCAAAERTCVRCDKPVPRAGRRVPGGVVCPSCRPHFTSGRPCEQCGRVSVKLSRRSDDPVCLRVCQHCANECTHATCTFCRRHRKIAGRTAEHHPFCGACGSTGASTHACPSCGVVLAGSGEGRCRSCLNIAGLEREVKLQILSLSRDDCRHWMAGFASWLHGRAPADPGLIADFSRHVPFIERVDSMLDETPRCSAAWLLEHVPVREQREHAQFMKFLEAEQGIVLSPEDKADAVERDRLIAILRAAHGCPYHAALVAFAEHLEAHGCKLRTRRQYLSTAAAFCAFAHVTDAGWDHAQLERFVTSRPGQRLSLGVFVRFCRQKLTWSVSDVPKPQPTSGASRSGKRFKELLARIEAAGADATEAMLSQAIQWAFAFRENELQEAALRQTATAMYLDLGDSSHRVPRELHQIVQRWHSSRPSRA